GFDEFILIKHKNTALGYAGKISAVKAATQHITETVFYASLNWDEIANILQNHKIVYQPIPKFPTVERDLALLVEKKITYQDLEKTVADAKISRLVSVKLFDVFESEKLGANKKSLAVNFTFSDDTKTLTDAEVEEMMQQIAGLYEQKLGAEVRKK
ncbi:MAG TPA: phenylalanine--tRNA ligase subunit beta, partial [Ferruginibacter sp.]|nr:phenylalanine--tRNA ligase subunit beta [Ferruginibacter sp.]